MAEIFETDPNYLDMKGVSTIDGLLQETIDTPGVNFELVGMQITRFEYLFTHHATRGPKNDLGCKSAY